MTARHVAFAHVEAGINQQNMEAAARVSHDSSSSLPPKSLLFLASSLAFLSFPCSIATKSTLGLYEFTAIPNSLPSMADPSDDLDDLLDSALDDFGKLDLDSAHRGKDVIVDGNREKSSSSSSSSTSSSLLPSAPVKGLGLGLPELRSKDKKGKQKVAKDRHVVEALEKLTQQTREAVCGLESTTAAARGDLGKDGMEDFVKQFEELAGSHDMESIVETMMQQLLSKEILHEPMKEIGERYPKWLEEHKAGLSNEDYDRYCHQYELINQLNKVYEEEPSNFPKIVELMQKMQECGQPPNDIVQELAPDLDLTNLGGQLSPEMLESSSNCCIM